MAQHGYLGDDYGSGYDPDYDEDRERGWRDEPQRGRRMMFEGRGGDWARGEDRGEDRGFISGMAGEARSWFRDDDERHSDWRGHDRPSDRGRGMARYNRERDFGGFQGDYGRSGGQQRGRGDYGQDRRSFSAHPDDHYRSWRDKQMQTLDREYEDYCREREQRFHQEFDSWRRNRQQGQQNQQPGSTTGQSDELILSNKGSGTTDAPQEPQATVGPDSGATVGTMPETTGRGRR